MRRTLGLGALVALGILLVLVVHPPSTRDDRERPGLLGVSAHAVVGVDAELDGHRLSARRSAGGWLVDGQPAPAPLAAALDDLVVTLSGLRALDRFHPSASAAYGLEHPRGRVVLATSRGERELSLGDLNAGGSALYAHRRGAATIVQIGVGVLSAVGRVFYFRDAAGAQRPETG